MSEVAATPVRLPRFPWGRYWIAFAIIFVFAISPFVPVYIASEIANANHCAVDENAIHECRIDGKDWGETLHVMGVLGWLFLVTMPLGGIAFFGWVAILIAHRLSFGSRQRRMRQ